MKILIIDNYDSFTWNLVHLVESVCGFTPAVKKNDDILPGEVEEYDKIILSPGPGLPHEAGVTIDIIKKYATTKSILGVCLGHQAIAVAFGGTLINLQQVFHGVAPVTRIVRNDILFEGLPDSFPTGRYHSWVADEKALPGELEVTAFDQENNIMALRHRKLDVRGVQFHPESILTPLGEKMMKNWLIPTGR
ncbi:MAG: aminodeoxychorismate/anthranilate synthase component II [Bacteroidetes bacterium]|nr:aminodeoxychorismate/anthranilate synthase component II [Bacteroidota bacterium]